jgi:hypothetical protein
LVVSLSVWLLVYIGWRFTNASSGIRWLGCLL